MNAGGGPFRGGLRQHLIDVERGLFPTSVAAESISDFLGQAFPVLGRALLDRTIERFLQPYRERRAAAVACRRSRLSSALLRCHLSLFPAIPFYDAISRQNYVYKA